jgi:hypothetical protein
MSRDAQKHWSKREAITTLVQINEELGKVLKGTDPKIALERIEKLLQKVKAIETPKVAAESTRVRNNLLPGPTRRKLRTVIQHNERMIAEIKGLL